MKPFNVLVVFTAGITVGCEKDQAEAKALEGWAKTDPRAAWAAVKDVSAKNPLAIHRVAPVLRELARVDLEGAMAQADAISGDMGTLALRGGILDAAAEAGTLDAVVRDAMQIESPANREIWIKDVFTRWGSIDTDAPMNALKTITNPDLARAAMTGLLNGWSDLDPRGAFDYAIENHADPVVSQVLASVINSAIHNSDETDVRTMMASVLEKGAFTGVAPQVLGGIAMSYPSFAFELATAIPSEPLRDAQTEFVLILWTGNDFKSAEAYFDGMPNSSAKAAAFPIIANKAMHQTDGPARVAGWIDGFSGQDRMRAVQSIITQQSNQPIPLNPETAAALAKVIAATPSLPAETLERAHKLFGSAPAP